MRFTIVQGHPDPAGGHYGHALAQAYASGAEAAGHEVRTIAGGLVESCGTASREKRLGKLHALGRAGR